jgi:glycosyltransferase involved in cell wall biosynthesis
VVQPYARTPGHYDRETQRSCEAFARAGHDVTLVTYCGIDTDAQTAPPPTFKVVNTIRAKHKSIAGKYDARKIYMSGFGDYVRWQIRDFRTSRLAASLLRPGQDSVVHFFNADLVLLTIFINFVLRERRSAILTTIHQVDRLFSASRRVTSKVSRRIYRACLKRLIEHDLDGIVVFDPSIKEAITNGLNINPEAATRIRVLPHGIGDPVEIPDKDEARRRLGLRTDETVFLVFGVLRADKRIDLAIEAIKGLSSCRLLIVGGQQDFTEKSISELALAYGCERSITAEVAYVSERKMHDYFSACDAVIIPYAASFKGQSGILTLACGHGRPVIASDVRTLGKAIKEHQLGFAVEPESSSALRTGISRFLALSTEERDQLEQRVNCYATLMSWDNTCKEWLEVYQRLSERRKSA